MVIYLIITCSVYWLLVILFWYDVFFWVREYHLELNWTELNLSCRKARKLFEKNAAPILYLAGIEVNVVKVKASLVTGSVFINRGLNLKVFFFP